MQSSTPLVVFSDLDGTLLDHVTYRWDPAAPALARLAACGCPVILSSSKTAAEIAPLQDEMGLTPHLAIVENGAGLLRPGQAADTAPQYPALRAALDRVPADLRHLFRGFGDMSLHDVMQTTGLSEVAATRAKARAFSEPGLWSGDAAQLSAFVAALKSDGVFARRGGRFLTLSFGKTKADRMDEVIAHYATRHSLALGDAPNDIEMLQKADFGVIVANPHAAPLPLQQGEDEGRIIRTTEPGPAGWNSAVLTLLDRLDLGKERHPHG